MTEPRTSTAARAVRGLRWAALLIGFGLIIEVATLNWAHPTAFLAFALLGVSLVVIGLVRYLLVALTLSP